MLTYDGRKQGTIIYIEIDGFRFHVLNVFDSHNKEVDKWLKWLYDRATGREYEGPINPKAVKFLQQTLYWTCPLDSAIMIGLASLKAIVEKPYEPRLFP